MIGVAPQLHAAGGLPGDVTGDNQFNLDEAIYALQITAGSRPKVSPEFDMQTY